MKDEIVINEVITMITEAIELSVCCQYSATLNYSLSTESKVKINNINETLNRIECLKNSYKCNFY